MDMMIKQSIKPQTSRMTFYLLCLVMISFGVFAELRDIQPVSTQMNAQTTAQIIQTTSIDQ